MNCKAWIRQFGYSFLEFALPRGTGNRVILNYHSVGDYSPGGLRLKYLRGQLQYLDCHFKVCTLEEFDEKRRNNSDSRNLAAITFDDGYLDSFKLAAPLLDEFGFSATFFITVNILRRSKETKFTNRVTMNLSQLKELFEQGHEIGSHGLTHQSLVSLPTRERTKQLRHSRTWLGDQLGVMIRSFAYPYGDWSEMVSREVADAGYHRAVTTEEKLVKSSTDCFQLPRIRVTNQLSMAGFRVKTSKRLSLLTTASYS